MDDIVNFILEKEREAERIVGDAKEKAAAILREADRKASNIVQEAKENAQKILRDTVEKVRVEIEKSKSEEMKKLNREFENFSKNNTDLIDKIINRVVEEVVHVEHYGD